MFLSVEAIGVVDVGNAEEQGKPEDHGTIEARVEGIPETHGDGPENKLLCERTIDVVAESV